METISIRLPDTLAQQLQKEAHLSRQSRSELIRDVLADYLHQRQRQRQLAAFAQEAAVLDAVEIEAVANDFAIAEEEALERAEKAP